MPFKDVKLKDVKPEVKTTESQAAPLKRLQKKTKLEVLNASLYGYLEKIKEAKPEARNVFLASYAHVINVAPIDHRMYFMRGLGKFLIQWQKESKYHPPAYKPILDLCENLLFDAKKEIAKLSDETKQDSLKRSLSKFIKIFEELVKNIPADNTYTKRANELLAIFQKETKSAVQEAIAVHKSPVSQPVPNKEAGKIPAQSEPAAPAPNIPRKTS